MALPPQVLYSLAEGEAARKYQSAGIFMHVERENCPPAAAAAGDAAAATDFVAPACPWGWPA